MLKQCSCLFINFIIVMLISPVVESNNRMWIYTELYSNSMCSYLSAEYAFGVSTDSCVTQSPFFESFFDLPLVKSFKIEGTDCSSTRLRLYEDSTCDEKDAVIKSIEDEKWDALLNTIGQCELDIRYTEPQYHSRLLCVPIIDDKIPTLNFNGFIASGYPEHYGLNTQQEEESCLTDALPSTFAAIPSDHCDSKILPYLIPSFPTVLTKQKSAYKFDCTNAEALGYATEYEYLNETICTGAGSSTKISLNVCNNVEQPLNPADSELSESSNPPQLLQGRHLQEDIKVERSPLLNLNEYENITMRYLSMLEELDNNGTQPIIHHVKYNCVKGNETKTVSPVASPTLLPTLTPTVIPSIAPSLVPTNQPSAAPSSAAPSATPSSAAPSYPLTYVPTVEETDYPSEGPTPEPSVSPTIEPTLKVGETRSPISKPSIRPSAAPSFQTFPVVSFVSSRNMSLDAKSASAVTSNSPDGEGFRKAMCNTQLKSQGLGAEASCSLTGIVQPPKRSRFLLASWSLFGFSEDGNLNLLTNHFRGEATDTTVVIDFTSRVCMVNFQNKSLSALFSKIMASSRSFSAKNFTQTLKKQAKAVGLTVTVTGVGSSFVSKDGFVVEAPPTFSPTSAPIRKSAGGGITIGGIIGIVVGGTAFIMILAACVVYRMCLAGKMKDRETEKVKVYAEL